MSQPPPSPGQYPPGQYPPGQYSPGQYSPGPYPAQAGQPAAPSPWQQPNDPRVPLGQQPMARVSIEEFSQPKSRLTWLIGVAVGLVVIGLIVAAVTLGKNPLQPSPSADTATPSPTRTQPTAASSASTPFHSQRDDADGYWQIDKQVWTPRGLELTMTLTITQGSMDYSFFALDNGTTKDYDPTDSTNDLAKGTARAGQTITGMVIFAKPKGDTTVILAGRGRQVAALIARG